MTVEEIMDYLKNNSDKVAYDIESGEYVYLVDKSMIPDFVVAEVDRHNAIEREFKSEFKTLDKMGL